MNIEEYQKRLTPEFYEKFREAVALGKWPDGRKLTAQQKAVCMQAIIAYEHLHVAEEERTGYVPPKDSACQHEPSEQPVKWQS